MAETDVCMVCANQLVNYPEKSRKGRCTFSESLIQFVNSIAVN